MTLFLREFFILRTKLLKVVYFYYVDFSFQNSEKYFVCIILKSSNSSSNSNSKILFCKRVVVTYYACVVELVDLFYVTISGFLSSSWTYLQSDFLAFPAKKLVVHYASGCIALREFLDSSFCR